MARQELRGLVEAGLASQDGVGPWTTYSLTAPRDLPEQRRPESDEDKILAFAREKGGITNQECQALLNADSNRAYYLLRKLIAAGRLRPSGTTKNRKYLPL